MAEPIRSYTPQRDLRDQLRRKVSDAPVEHAAAVLSAYELLQEAQDHGVLDTLRGAIGAGDTFIGKASEYANTPEGIRALRNLLSLARLLGEVDPAILHAAAEALAGTQRSAEKDSPPSLWRTLQRLTGPNSQRALARVAVFAESFGSALNVEPTHPGGERKSRSASGVAVPVVFSAAIVMAAVFWIGRRSSSR